MAISMTIIELTALIATLQQKNQATQLIQKPEKKYICLENLEKLFPKSINLEEFIEEFDYRDYNKLESEVFEDFVFYSIRDNLEKYENFELPIIASDLRRKNFYYKTNGVWIKGTEFYNILYRLINKQFLIVFNIAFPLNKNNKSSYSARDNDEEEYDPIKEKLEEKAWLESRGYAKQLIVMNWTWVGRMSRDKFRDYVCGKLARKVIQDDN